jgi:hypothetical protein
MAEAPKPFEIILQSLLLLLEEDDKKQQSIKKSTGEEYVSVNAPSFEKIYKVCFQFWKDMSEFYLPSDGIEYYQEFLQKFFECKESFVKLLLSLAVRRDTFVSGTGDKKRYQGYVSCCLLLMFCVNRAIERLVRLEIEEKRNFVQLSSTEVPIHGQCLQELIPLLYELALQIFSVWNNDSTDKVFEDHEWDSDFDTERDPKNWRNQFPKFLFYSFAQQRTLLMTSLLLSISKTEEAIATYISDDRQRVMRMVEILKTIILTGGLKNESSAIVPGLILDRACRSIRELIKGNTKLLTSSATLVEDLISIGLQSKQYEIFYAFKEVPDAAKVAMKAISKHLPALLQIKIRTRFDNVYRDYDVLHPPKDIDWGLSDFLRVFSETLSESPEHSKAFMQMYSTEEVKTIFVAVKQRWALFCSITNPSCDHLIGEYEDILKNLSTIYPTIAFPFIQEFVREAQGDDRFYFWKKVEILGIAGNSLEPSNAAEIVIRQLLTLLRANKDRPRHILEEIHRLQKLLPTQTCILNNLPAIKRFHFDLPAFVKPIVDLATKT